MITIHIYILLYPWLNNHKDDSLSLFLIFLIKSYRERLFCAYLDRSVDGKGWNTRVTIIYNSSPFIAMSKSGLYSFMWSLPWLNKHVDRSIVYVPVCLFS